MQSVTVEDARRRLPELLERAAAGERITIDAKGARLEIVRAAVGAPALRKKPITEIFAEIRGLAEDLLIERDPSPERPVEL